MNGVVCKSLRHSTRPDTISGGVSHEKENATFTKEYTVGFKRADFHIQTVLWNFVGSKL